MDRFAVVGAQVFDGVELAEASVVVDDGVITTVGPEIPPGTDRIDGRGGTLLPGLIDAHTHADEAALRTALRFGVTTELDLTSDPAVMGPLRRTVRTGLDLADVRSSSWGLTTPDGHPHQLRHGVDDPEWPTVTRPADAADFVDARISEGADYIKVLVEDGSVFGTPLPVVSRDVLEAIVDAAHQRRLMVLVHTLSAAATRMAVESGADALAHLQIDEILADDLVARIADQDMFVIPTLRVASSAASEGGGRRLADDLRVAARLTGPVRENLAQDFALGTALETALASVRLLRSAGVDILAGSDAAFHLGVPGLTHGAGLHDELRLLTLAGFTPVEALHAATRLTADRFGLPDRGRIAPGVPADMVLVDGDAGAHIGATLNLRSVWRRGHRLGGDELAVA